VVGSVSLYDRFQHFAIQHRSPCPSQQLQQVLGLGLKPEQAWQLVELDELERVE